MGLAASLTLAVYRSLSSGSDREKFDRTLEIIQSSELSEIDNLVGRNDVDVIAKKGWSWNNWWLTSWLQAGKTVEDPSAPGRTMLTVVAVALAFGFLVFPGGTNAPLAAAMAVLGARAYFSFLIQRRKNTMDKQMSLMLSALRSQMHAGVTVQAALINIADDLPSPLGDEVRQVKRDVNVSISLDNALEALAIRVPTRHMQFLVASINIAVKSGSDLVPQLATIEEIVQQRARIEGKIKSAVALAKPTAYLGAGAPPIMFAWLMLTNPDYPPHFFGKGFIQLMIAVVLYVIGLITIKLMIRNVENT